LWNDRILQLHYPQLYSFTLNENITVVGALAMEFLQDLFTLPLSEEAFDQFLDLQLWMQSIEISEVKDVWSYIWGSTHYSSQKAYKHLIGSSPVHPAFRWIWKASCQMRQSIFLAAFAK
jgi:hypothetical protein